MKCSFLQRKENDGISATYIKTNFLVAKILTFDCTAASILRLYNVRHCRIFSSNTRSRHHSEELGIPGLKQGTRFLTESAIGKRKGDNVREGIDYNKAVIYYS